MEILSLASAFENNASKILIKPEIEYKNDNPILNPSEI